MGLTTYKKKRSFSRTPEPTGGKADTEVLRFVVQKHAASHLHYDFRLEMGGVLKSWAVPKGPSMDPDVKRLAMMVEDHPFDYRNFEGVIPEGNYGAGTVIVWDEGIYHADDEFPDKKSEDKALLRQWHAGKISFILQGKKLKGAFALVKASSRGENSWLLMKLKDKYADKEDILLKDRSVISRKTLEQVKAAPQRIYGQKSVAAKTPRKKEKAAHTVKKTARKTSSAPHARKEEPASDDASSATSILQSAPKKKFYTNLVPMLATLVDKPIDQPGWLYEIKWDGYRAVAFIHEGVVELKSRNDKSFNKKFYPLYHALEEWNINAIVDGEIVVIGENGQSDFGALQNWRSEADGDLVYYLFDVVWLNGKDLCNVPLEQRRAVLQSIAPGNGMIRVSESFDVTAKEFYAAATQMGLEGMMAKKADSLYISGTRTTEWLKIKANKRQEVVIGGYTQNENSGKAFSSLLVGVYEGNDFVYTGKIGTGFTQKQQQEMMQQFKPLVVKKHPFTRLPDYNKPSRFNPRPAQATATWLKPELVCEVSYTEITSDGVMRHPSFEGMRVDKKAHDVTRENAIPAEEVVGKDVRKAKSKFVEAHARRERSTLLNPTDETQVREVDGHSIKFTNLSKLYWPDEKVTKRDMLNYYYQVAPYILPYLKDRPQSLNRFPNGIKSKSFYQKDVTGKVPDWVSTYLYHSSDEIEVDKHFMIPKSEADVLLMASMGCIEMNPWSSRVDTPDYPDWCIIDLDPDKNSFDQVIIAAQVTHQLLDSIGIPSYCKTSGSTGLHIYIPLGARYTYEQSKEFARVLVTHVHKEIPTFTSIERIVSNRKGKMYLDFLQNRPKATLAAPYSLRPKPGATVSMPLHWDEVKKGLKMTDFTIFNAVGRIRETGDLFKPVLGKGIDLDKMSRKLS
ncbi:MAG TPA: DNA ligase D [Ohtaekwangia sp.]|uniref:DNA ligase D n=1 Tax=Ohtaekwangia sp. TaxID=2066019 RepID=UPI002F93D8A8